MIPSRRVLFLPGASGDGRFWHPVAERPPVEWEKVFCSPETTRTSWRRTFSGTSETRWREASGSSATSARGNVAEHNGEIGALKGAQGLKGLPF